MHDGGDLTIVTKKEILSGSTYVAVKVTDTGVGIPEDERHIISEPFFAKKTPDQPLVTGLCLSNK